jgi:AcrR family transcriptional regulator
MADHFAGGAAMANFTRRAIKETFLKLLNQRPLNQITVKDIVEDCGINRNSFYYHFDGLPALVDEIVQEQVQALIQNHPTISSVEECFDAVVELVMENRRAVYHIYNSLNRDLFERYLMDACQYIVSTYLQTEFAGSALSPEDLRTLIRFHKCECFGSVIDWLNGGMKDDIAAYFRRVCALQKGWMELLGR